MCPHRYRKLKLERWYCHDIINYQITERICKNVWKRPPPPAPPLRRQRGRAASALEPAIQRPRVQLRPVHFHMYA